MLLLGIRHNIQPPNVCIKCDVNRALVSAEGWMFVFSFRLSLHQEKCNYSIPILPRSREYRVPIDVALLINFHILNKTQHIVSQQESDRLSICFHKTSLSNGCRKKGLLQLQLRTGSFPRYIRKYHCYLARFLITLSMCMALQVVRSAYEREESCIPAL